MKTNILGWLFGIIVAMIGIANVLLVHPVPGVAYLLLSLIYFPPVSSLLERRCSLRVPLALKIILAVAIVWFTLGISDLGDMFV